MRKVVIAVVTCALALTAILVLLLATLDIGRYRGLIEAQASQAVGRDVKLAGAMGFDLALHPTLVAEQVSVANPSWASRPLLATFERVEATIGLLPLLARRVEIDRLALDGADIGLERAADGRPNWQLTAAAPTTGVSQAQTESAAKPHGGGAQASELPTTAASSIPFVREVRIRNSRIAYRDAASGIDHELRLAEGRIAASDVSSPVVIDLAGELDGKPMSLKGEVGALAALMAGTGPYPVDLHVKALGLDIEVSGAAALRGGDELDLRATASAADSAAVRTALGPYLTPVELLEGSGPLHAAGRLRGTVERPAIEDLALSGRLVGLDVDVKGSVSDLMGMSGIDLAVNAQGDPVGLRALAPALPAGAMNASAQVTGAASALALDRLKLEQGDNDLAGRLKLVLGGPRPKITGQLTSQRLALPVALGGAADNGDRKKSGPRPLFANTPLDLSGLRAFDADLGVEVARLAVGGIEVRTLALRASLAGGALTIDRLDGWLAGSPFESTAVLDGSKDVPSARLRLDSQAFDLGALLGQFGITDLLQAKGRVRVALEATGDSPRALARSLAGRVDSVFENGRISADAVRQPIIGLQRFFGTVLSPFRSEWVALSCLAASFTIKDGVARPDVMFSDNAISSSTGEGKIDIGRERYALTITPRAKGINLDLGLPIRVTGPLNAPDIGVDEKGAVAGVGALVGKLLFPPALITGMVDFAGKDSPCVRSAEAAKGQGAKQAPSSIEDAAGAVLEGLGRSLEQLLPR